MSVHKNCISPFHIRLVQSAKEKEKNVYIQYRVLSSDYTASTIKTSTILLKIEAGSQIYQWYFPLVDPYCLYYAALPSYSQNSHWIVSKRPLRREYAFTQTVGIFCISI